MLFRFVLINFFSMFACACFSANAAEVDTLFHVGTNKLSWDRATQKVVESCNADYQEILHGRKPVLAQPDPAKESTATDQYYYAEGYRVHITKAEVTLDGVAGFVYGGVIDLEPAFAEGDMHALFHTSFHAPSVMSYPNSTDAPFYFESSKAKAALGDKARKRLQACAADYKAVLAGKKPSNAKAPPDSADPHFYKGEGYHIDIIEVPLSVGGVNGFLYGPMIDFDPPLTSGGALDSISHVSFYTAAELKALLGRK
jgi:hypothetical protein